MPPSPLPERVGTLPATSEVIGSSCNTIVNTNANCFHHTVSDT